MDEKLDPKLKLCLSEQAIPIEKGSTVQKLTVSDDFLKICLPARIHVTGPTQCGKSTMIFQLVKHRADMFMAAFSRIILCLPSGTMHQHAEYVSRMTDVFPTLEINEGLPDPHKLGLFDSPDDHKLLILDDLIVGLVTDPSILQLFLKDSHHCSISIIFSSQNYFIGKNGSTIMRNCSELVLFYNKSDQMLLQNIGRQLFPGSPRFLQSAFKFIAKEQPLNPLKYLWIDMNNASHLPPDLKVRTNVLPVADKTEPIFFLPINQK